MLIAQQKYNENIAEYLIYMYQIEDLIRSANFNIDTIIEGFVRPQLPDDSFINSYKKWYQDLINKMINERVEKEGHISDLKDIMVELSYLHNSLLNVVNDTKYVGVYERAVVYINEFIEKSNLKNKNHVEIAFNALYMKLLMRLQKKEISAETEEAFDAMRVMVAYLAKKYHQMKNGSLDFMNN